MSEAAEAVAPAPASTPEQTPPSPQPEAPQEQLTARERQERITQAARGVGKLATAPEQAKPVSVAEGVNAPKVDANGRAHAPETGQYLPGAPGQAEDVEAAPKQAAEATPTEQESAPEAKSAADLPDGFVLIDVPESNPLYARLRQIPVREKDANTIRGVLNQAANVEAQKEHLSRLIQERDTERRERLRLEAAMRFEREHASEYWTPTDQALYDDIVQTYSETLGEDEAKRRAEAFKRGKLAEAEEARGKVVEEADMELERETIQSQAQLFTTVAIADAKNSFPHWSEGDVRAALQAYGAYMDVRARQGNPVPFNLNDARTAAEWKKFAQAQYATHPAVQQARQEQLNQAAQQRAEQEAKDREQERLRAVAESRRTNPLGRTPGTQTSKTTPGDKPMTAQERQRMITRRAKGLM